VQCQPNNDYQLVILTTPQYNCRQMRVINWWQAQYLLSNSNSQLAIETLHCCHCPERRQSVVINNTMVHGNNKYMATSRLCTMFCQQTESTEIMRMKHSLAVNPFSPTFFWLWQKRVYHSVQRHTGPTHPF